MPSVAPNLAERLPRWSASSAISILCQRLGRRDEALSSYRRALDLSQQEPEQRLMRRRIAELENDQ